MLKYKTNFSSEIKKGQIGHKNTKQKNISKACRNNFFQVVGQEEACEFTFKSREKRDDIYVGDIGIVGREYLCQI